MHLGIILARDTQHVDDAADRLGAAFGPVRHQHGDLHAVGGFQAADLRKFVRTGDVDPDIVGHVLAFDDGPDLPPADHQDTDMRLGAAPDDLDHLAFEAAARGSGLEPALRDFDLHEIAVEREVEFAHGDEYVVRAAFHFHEAETVARKGDRPLEFLHRLGAALLRPDRLLFSPCQPLRPLERTLSPFVGIFSLFAGFAIR